MTSFLIIAKDTKARREYMLDLCNKQTITAIDITVIERDETKQSIGIADIKLLQKKIFLKPIRSRTKAVILEDGQLLTVEAQNAMLKLLEEPPEHTLIFIAADSEETLLPTIQSRCQIIKLKEETKILNENDKQEINLFLDSLNEITISPVLKKAEILAKDKQKAIEWIEKVILLSREKMILQNTFPSPYFDLLKSLQSLHTLLKTTNVNPRFAIEKTLLHLIN